MLLASTKPLCFPSGLRFTSFASVNDRTRAVGESTLPTSAWQCCKKAKEQGVLQNTPTKKDEVRNRKRVSKPRLFA